MNTILPVKDVILCFECVPSDCTVYVASCDSLVLHLVMFLCYHIIVFICFMS